MNWDISIGQGRQLYGRMLQAFGRRFDRRQWVLTGERIEYSGRLQSRYGVLKHTVQWGPTMARIPRESGAAPIRDALPTVERIPL
jgi:hypothetical protein